MLEDVGWTKGGGASQARRERQHADCVTGLRAGIGGWRNERPACVALPFRRTQNLKRTRISGVFLLQSWSSELLQHVSDALSGVSVPKRRNAASFGFAFENRRQFRGKLSTVLAHQGVRSHGYGNRPLRVAT